MYKSAAALGLSTFCARVAMGLEEADVRVIAVDINENRIRAIQDKVTNAYCADLRNKELLSDIGVGDCSLAVVGLPDHFDIEVLVVHFLAEMKIPEIVVQVTNEDQASAIEKVGATVVVFPEQSAADSLVKKLTLPSMLEVVSLAEDAAIIEVECPPQFVGMSLKDLDLRRKYNVHVVGMIHQPDAKDERRQTVLAPGAEEPFKEGDIIMVLGKTGRLRYFTQQIEKLQMKVDG